MNNKIMIRVVLSLAIIIGFFLPWFKDVNSAISGWDIVRHNSMGFSNDNTGVILHYSFALIPLTALIVFVRSVGKQSSGFLIRLLPFLVLAIVTCLFILGSSKTAGGEELRNAIAQILSYGFYICSVASLILIFT